MPIRLPLFVTLAAILSAGSGVAQTAAEQDVLQTQQRRLAAAQKQDVAALERLVADELQYCHTTGAVDTKASYLDVVKTGRIRWINVKPSGMKARVYGDTAVVTGRIDQQITTAGNPTPTDLAIRTIEVYVKRDGRWQMTDFQASRIPAPAAKPTGGAAR
jgi:ketosteroid isomerase-like protein